MLTNFIRGAWLLLLCVSPVMAGGLRTHLGEVVVENLHVGQMYSLAELANLSLRVTNTSDYRVGLRMEVLIPDEVELKHAAEPIPDLSWIGLTCDSFTLDAGQDAVADIIIRIPDEDRYLGKRFQFMIWSHTVPTTEGGMYLATGLKSRIIFTTDSIRADSSSDSVGLRGNAAFSVIPTEIRLNAVPLGVRHDIRQSDGTVLIVRNTGDEPLTLRVSSKSVAGSLATVEPDWEDTPDAGYLNFDRDEIFVAPHSEEIVNLFLNVPAEPGLYGKRLMFLIYVYDQTRSVTTGVYTRLFAALRKN